MAKVEMINGKPYWIDAEGNPTAQKYIDKGIQNRDKLVEKLIVKAQRMHKSLVAFKESVEGEIAEYLTAAAKAQGLEQWIGGTTLVNFSGDQSVTIKIAKRWQFDEKLQLAKQKIDDVIKREAAGSSEMIISLVNRAFRVDAKGEVDAKQILGLRQIKCTDPVWIEAMGLIADSQTAVATKTYYYFQVAGEDGKMETIVLDLAAL